MEVEATENKYQNMKKVYNSRYYQKHREQLLTKIKEKKTCDVCGKCVSMSNMNRHKKGGNCNKIET